MDGTIAIPNIYQTQVIACSSYGEAAGVVREDMVGGSNLFESRGLEKKKQFAINIFRWITFQSNKKGTLCVLQQYYSIFVNHGFTDT
jgi:hypothetical protein